MYVLTFIANRLIIHKRLTILKYIEPIFHGGWLMGTMTFRIIEYKEMLNINHFLISRHCSDPQQRPLMVFAHGLIKWIELKNLTDVLRPRSFTASRPGTHIVSISGGSVQLGTAESWGQMTGLRRFKWSTLCSYRAPSKSMRLVCTVSQTVTFTNGLHRSMLCILAAHGVENYLSVFGIIHGPGVWRWMTWPLAGQSLGLTGAQ